MSGRLYCQRDCQVDRLSVFGYVYDGQLREIDNGVDWRWKKKLDWVEGKLSESAGFSGFLYVDLCLLNSDPCTRAAACIPSLQSTEHSG